MILSPSAAHLMADLHPRGIDVQVTGDTIRYRPRDAVTPDLMQRLQTHKVELLAMSIIQNALDLGNDDLAEALAEAWGERIAICIEDGKVSRPTAETIALAQLRMMMEMNT